MINTFFSISILKSDQFLMGCSFINIRIKPLRVVRTFRKEHCYNSMTANCARYVIIIINMWFSNENNCFQAITFETFSCRIPFCNSREIKCILEQYMQPKTWSWQYYHIINRCIHIYHWLSLYGILILRAYNCLGYHALMHSFRIQLVINFYSQTFNFYGYIPTNFQKL